MASGQILRVRVANDNCSADYQIDDLPKGQLLRVTVTPHGLQPPNTEMDEQPPGVAEMTLTVAEPTRSGVDFVAELSMGPA